MLNLLPQLRMEHANTISTISSSVKSPLNDSKNSSVTVCGSSANGQLMFTEDT